MRISRAKTYWIAVAIFGLAISLPLAWVFSRAHQTHTLQAEAGTVYVLQPEDWLSPLVLMTGALSVATVFLACFTFGLFSKTADTVADARQAAADVRSIIRGAGTAHKVNGSSRPNRFLIEASNSGEGPALIERVHWRFVEFTEFAKTNHLPYPNTEVSGEVVPRRMRSQPTKFVEIPNDLTDPVIVFRFDYYDINRKRSAIIEHAMRVVPHRVPELPAFFNVPPGFLADDFPVHSEQGIKKH